MVAAKSPDWLPSGWTVQIKIKNGRKIKCFSNQETGQKFHSKNEVLRYTQILNVQSETTKPTNSKNNRSSNDKSSVDMKTDESPEWLPDGWTMELKTRKSGSNMGAKYKCYIDPEAGHKFYSKPEVLQYLETAKHSNCTDKRKKRGNSSVVTVMASPDGLHSEEFSSIKCVNGMNKDLVAVKTDETPEWLPDGWTMELKTRKTGSHMASKYKCYIDPEAGHKFYSKPEVLQYLKTVNQSNCEAKMNKIGGSPDNSDGGTRGTSSSEPVGSQALKTVGDKNFTSGQKTIDNNEHATKDVVEAASPDGLPPGWIKEFKPRKYAKGIKMDPYYTDPVSGYMFRSKLDVLRYLETGDINRCAIRPKKRDDNDSEKISNCIPVGLQDNSDGGTRGAYSSVRAGSQALKTMEEKNFTSDQKTINNNEHTTKDVVVAVSPDGLPPGWIKEVKPRKYAKGIKMDPYYTDPVSGYMFRSKLDVLRYLETGDISRCAIRPKKRDDNDLEKISNGIPVGLQFQSAADKKKLIKGTRRQLFAGKKNLETSSLSATETIGSKKRKGKASGSNQNKMMLSQNESPSAHNVQLQKTPENARKDHTSRKTQVSGGRSKNRKALSLPTRLSKRHAGLNPEMLTDLSEIATCAAVKKSAEVAVFPSFNLAPDTAPNETVHQFETEPGFEIPQHASRREELPSESKPLNSIKKILDDQIVSPKFTGQETEKQDFKIPELRELPFSYTSGDSWSDPCLEFAFSLTGAMHLSVEGNVGTQGLSKQQHDPVQSDVCIELPKFDFQNDVSLGLDSAEECLHIKQLPANPVSQPSCSSIESPQPSLSIGARHWKHR